MGERKINVEIRIGRDEDGDWWTVLMVDDDEALWRTRHLLHDSYGGPARPRQEHIWSEPDQIHRVRAITVDIERWADPAEVKPHIAAFDPPQLPQPLHERCDARRRFGIVLREG